MDAESLDDSQIAIARSRLYRLLAELFLHGLRPDLIGHVQALSPFVDALDAMGCLLEDPAHLDELAAAHERLFGFNVFPMQGVFLGSKARTGGEETRRILAFYQKISFPTASNAEGPDHIGALLHCLAFLSRAEAEADDPQYIELIKKLTTELFDQHLLRWLPSLTVAMRRLADPFHAALINTTFELAMTHREALETPAATTFELPAPTLDLDHPRTSLSDLAAFWLTPSSCGIFVSREDIRRLSRSGDLPAGFGPRQTMMHNLLHSAADYDGVDGIARGLEALFDETQRSFLLLREQHAEAWTSLLTPWLEVLKRSRALLTTFLEGAHAARAPQDS